MIGELLEQIAVESFLYGVLFAGASCIFGFGVSAAINLFKLFGGIR